MRKVKLYTAVSLNGMIARADGQVDWLEKIDHEEGEDYGYSTFYNGIDTTLMGNNTYKQVLGFGVEFPYKEKKNYVFTRKKELKFDENVVFISDNITKFVQSLKREKGRDIWLIGGGQLNSLFLNEQLIDEVHVHIMPIVIPDGIQLFRGEPLEQQFILKSTRSFKSGVIECVYKVKK